MTFEDAIEDWKSNDEWQFADREACWKFMFEKGQESLRQQLAAAIAACKLKDEALELIALDDCCTDPAPIAQKALAIQPDDAALKAWIGEPVAWHHDVEGLSYSNHYYGCVPLYSPKELK